MVYDGADREREREERVKWAKDREREKKKKYEKRRGEHESYYREMSDDQLLEEVARKFPGCPDDMCFACLDNKKLIDELRSRIKRK